MNTWQDYHIYGYSVDSLNRRLTFTLAWLEGDAEDVATLEFFGVCGYELNNDSMVSVIAAFEEVNLDRFFAEHGPEIKNSYWSTGAYGAWAADLDRALDDLRREGTRAFILSPAHGMFGWVLAKGVIEKAG